MKDSIEPKNQSWENGFRAGFSFGEAEGRRKAINVGQIISIIAVILTAIIFYNL